MRFAACASASDATEYAASSIGSASRLSAVISRFTGIAERCASARNAGARPLREDGRVDRTRDLLQVLQRIGQPFGNIRQPGANVAQLGRKARLGGAYRRP